MTGQCFCGSVAFEFDGPTTEIEICHCSRCRKATGTGHASNLFLQPAALTWLTGSENIRRFKVPEAQRFANHFCGTCGGRLPRQPEVPASAWKRQR